MNRKWLVPALISFALVFASAGEKADSLDLDPVIADVVRMLGEGVEPAIVAVWLESNGTWPARVSPDDLVGLSRAGAPDSLVLELLEHAGAQQEESPAPEPRDSAGETAGVAAGGKIPVRFSVRYRRETDEYHDEEEPWGLYLYLDGSPLARHPGTAARVFGADTELDFRVLLEPGMHVVRILQERHILESKKKNRWSHEARVYLRAVELDLTDHAGYGLALEVNEIAPLRSKHGGPVSFRVTREGVTVLDVEGDGPDTADWPALCEEVETGIPDEKRSTRAADRERAGCVRWSTLWPSARNVPDRRRVRDALAAQDYRPLPADSSTRP